MRYMFTLEPDELCHETDGVYGRPVHTSEEPKLRKAGWVFRPSDLKGDDHVREGKEEGRKEEGQVAPESGGYDPEGEAFRDSVVAEYEEKFGRKPHHKMKTETILKKLEESDD